MKIKSVNSGSPPASGQQNSPDPQEVNALIALFTTGRYAEAAAVARAMTLRFPQDGFGWAVSGTALMQLGQNADALAPMQKAATMMPENPDVHNNLGTLLQQAGRLDEAEGCCRRALQIKPDYAEAHNNLGTIWLKRERWEEAEKCFRRALELNPQYAQIHNNLGVALRNQGRMDEAEACFRRALERHPEYVEALVNLGMALQHNGRMDEAADCYRRLLQIAPDYAEAHNSLGNVCLYLGRMDEAFKCYRRAVAIAPDYAAAHNNLGVTLYELGCPDEAAASYLRALQIRPDYVEAHNNLGNVYLELGKLEEAVASYRRAIELNPSVADPYGNLGSALVALGRMEEAEKYLNEGIARAPDDPKILTTALTHLPYRQDDPRFSQLETVYARRAALAPEARIKLNFAMGRAMENIGQYDRSFSAYEEGNRLYYQSHPFDEAGEERKLEQALHFFTKELFSESAALPKNLPPLEDERVPIFIVGMFRSGTTLVEQMLASHPAIFGAGELPTLQTVLQQRDAADSTSNEDALLSLQKLGQEYLNQVWKLAPQAHYITDKLPGNYSHLGLIHLMLPNAKIIHCVRDPMDTCFSCYALRFTYAPEYCYDLGALGRQYLRYRKLMQHWHDVLPPGRILDVRYEDTVADPEREARRMLDYLGLPWDPACLDFSNNRRAVLTASSTQVRKPIYSSSVARWKHFEKHLRPLLEIVQGTFPDQHGTHAPL
jgi:tetratricopeptide (TPR) repeat protein